MLLARARRRAIAGLSTPESIWIAAVILAPFDAVFPLPLTVLGVQLSPPRIAILAASVASLLAAAWTGRLRLRIRNVFFGLFFAWLSWNLLSGLWAVSETDYWRYTGLLIMNGLLFLCTLHIATSARKFRLILGCVLLSVLVTVLFGIAEVVVGFRVPASRQWAFLNEVTSVFVNPSHFGGALALFAPVVLLYPIWSPRRSAKAVLGATILFVFTAYFVVRSGARGAVLALIFGCVTSLVLSSVSRHSLRRMTVVGAALGTIVLVAVSLQLVPRVPEVLSDKIATLRDPAALIAGEYRLVLWSVGWQLWTESPLVGWGAGASERLLYERAPWLTAYSLHAWNLETLVNTGVVGAALWGLLVIALVLGLLGRFTRRGDHHTRFAASSLLGGLAASVMISLTVGSLMTFPLFWVHMGLCASFASLPRTAEDELVGRGRRSSSSLACVEALGRARTRPT
ncbi:MAG: O-antigen ligase family protein [Thermoleophilia bacterium]|nr:O-antigen ligase family protein [Thermoleophilia bacterium]